MKLILILSLFLIFNSPLLAQNIHNIPPNIKNFGNINDCFYRSGQPDKKHFRAMAILGVKTAINFRTPFLFSRDNFLEQERLAESLGMTYYNIPMIPFSPPSDEQLNLYFDILNNPENYPVWIYDANGKDRVGRRMENRRRSHRRRTYCFSSKIWN